AFADHEVVDAVSRRAVNHARTSAQLDVVSQVHRRQTIVERVTEVDQLQRRTRGGGKDGTFQLVTSQAAFNQLGCQYQQPVAHIYQRVFELGVNVQRLVGRDGPRRGC